MCPICRKAVAAGLICICLHGVVAGHHDSRPPDCKPIDSADRQCQIAQVGRFEPPPDEEPKGPTGPPPRQIAMMQSATGPTGPTGTFWHVPPPT